MQTPFQARLNNALNNAMTELNNKQQQKERGIQRNRQGPGDAFADEAGSELVGYRKAVPDGRSCREGKDLTATAVGLQETGRG